MTTPLRSQATLLFCLASAAACSSEGPAPSYTCTKDPALLRTEVACLDTATCPCGTRCAFGRCVSDCAEDLECGEGGVCDAFGRCRFTDGASPERPLVSTANDNFYQVAPSVLAFGPEDTEAALAVRMGAAAVETTLRIASGSGRYLVSCGPGEDFAADCTLALNADQPWRTLTVRRVDGVEAGPTDALIRVSSEGRVKTVVVEDEVSRPAPPTIEPGSFVGRARLAGLVSTETGVRALRTPVDLPVAVQVGGAIGQRYPVTVDDALNLFSSPNAEGARPILGYLETPDGVQVGFVPSAPMAYFDVRHPAVPSVDATTLFAEIEDFHRAPNRMRFTLRQTIRLGPSPLILRWRFALDRAGDGAAHAQAAPEAAPPPGGLDARVTDVWPVESSWHAQAGLGTTATSTGYATAQVAVCGRDGRARGFGRGLATKVERQDQTNREMVYYDGEVSCTTPDGEDTRWAVFPFLDRPALATQDFEGLLVDCSGELEGVGDDSCVDHARWLSATSLALETARQVALDGDADANVPAQRLGAYLVTRYLDLDGYLSQVYRNQTTFRTFLEIEDPLPAGFPDDVARLESTLSAWAPLLHPRLLEPLMRLHPRVLLQPDYRLEHASQDVLESWGAEDDVHATPVHVAITGDLARQADHWRRTARRLKQGRIPATRAPAARRALTDAARKALVLYALASELDARADYNRPPGVEFAWESEMESQSRSFERAFAATAESLAADRIEISELALPWYRVGDQATTGARFRAMTDFFLGDGQTLGGVVGGEVARAAELYSSAIDGYARYRSESFRLLAFDFTESSRTDYLAFKTGAGILDLCGYDRARYDARGGYAALSSEPDPTSCFIDPSPSCDANLREPTVPELGYKLCRAGFLARRVGVGEAREQLWLEGLPENLDDVLTTAEWQLEPRPGQAWQARLTHPQFSSPKAFTVAELDFFLAYTHARGESASLFADAEAYCGPVYDLLRTGGDPADDCEVQVDAAHPAGTTRSTCEGVGAYQRQLGELSPSCFRGQLGVSLLAVRAAELEVREAEAEVQQILDELSVDLDGCELQLSAYQEMAGIYATYVSLMEELRGLKSKLERAIAGLEATSACLTAMSRIKVPESPGGLIGFAASAKLAAASCAVEATIGAVRGELSQVERDIDLAEDQLYADLDLLEARTEVTTCFNDLRTHLAELKPAGVRVRGAVARYDAALGDFEEKQRLLVRLWDEGKQWEANIEGRRLVAVAEDFEYAERFARLEDAVARVQGALLYAGRAAEFELQQSVFNAAEVLATQDLRGLEEIATSLRSAVISGRVGGGAATSAQLVLSLKDQILRIPEPGGQPSGFHRLESSTVFQDALRAPRLAVYDDEGGRVGQALRFTLSPEGLGAGEAGLAEVLGGRVCGERVWSVGAVVVGEDAVPLDGSVITRLFLRKRNSFYSRRCGGDGEPVVGFVSPDSLVFADGGERPGVQERYTNALLNAPVYRSDYVAGARIAVERGQQAVEGSRELAGWGLYGDYELLVPVESTSEDRLDLSKVQDILLVFDLLVVSES